MANRRCLLCGGTGKKIRCHRVRYKEMGATEGCNGYNTYSGSPNDCNCPVVNCNCSSAGGCFVTTDALVAAGKQDNCEELNIFRNYRDEYLIVKFKEDVDLYYNVSPEILKSINLLENNQTILQNLWFDELTKTLELIKNNEFEKAYNIYKLTIKDLYDKYVK